MLNKADVMKALSHVQATDNSTNIVEAKHVTNIQIFGDEVEIDVISTLPTLHVKKKLEVDILKAIHDHAFAKAKVKTNIKVIEAAPKTFKNESAPELPGVKNIIAIASGKGGVGKSTITANLAVALAQMGFSVGLVDADIYGPSMPMMFDVESEHPKNINIDGKNKINPVESYGVKLLSIGFFAKKGEAVVWRGPMATNALNQMIRDAHWGDLDFLLIDLPPGTGDIHLSLVQSVPVTGAVIVSTPQAVALADARKGVSMFAMDAINVPVLGLIENMAYFTPEELPNNKYYIFGKEGARELAEELNTPFLGEVPIIQSIRESGDVGRPAILQENTIASKAFNHIATRVVEEMVERNEKLPPTEIVRITNMAGCSPKKEKV